MPTIDSTIQAVAVQFPLLVLFLIALKWVIERQDKKEAAKDTLHATQIATLTASFQAQIKEQKEAHEKESLGVIQRYEVVTNKVLEVGTAQAQSMLVLNKTFEQFVNLRSFEERLNSMIKETERGK